MTKNRVINIVTAIAISAFVFSTMLFIYHNSYAPESLSENKNNENIISLDYSFYDISKDTVIFNVNEKVVNASPIITCGTESKNIVAISTKILNLVPNTTYQCKLSIDDKEYDLNEFTTLPVITKDKLDFQGELFPSAAGGKTVRLNWNSSIGETILTKSLLIGDVQASQTEYLIQQNTYTETVSLSEGEKILYEIRSVNDLNIFSSFLISNNSEGEPTIEESLLSVRVLSDSISISTSPPIKFDAISDKTPVVVQIGRVYLLVEELPSNYNSIYWFDSVNNKLNRVYKDYYITGATLKDNILSIDGYHYPELEIEYMISSQESYTAELGKDNSILLEKVYPYIYLYNGLDRYVRVGQTLSAKSVSWDDENQNLNWEKIPGVLFYMIEVSSSEKDSKNTYMSTSNSYPVKNLAGELTAIVYAFTEATHYTVGGIEFKTNPLKNNVDDVSLAKLDNTVNITWTSIPELSYIIEIKNASESSSWKTLQTTKPGAASISIKNISQLSSDKYMIRITPTYSGETGISTESSCIIDISENKTFRIICE